jgi:transcription elongation factor Elf1
MKKVVAVTFICNICGEKHREEVSTDKLSEWAKSSVQPIFVCPNCGDDGLVHINNAHIKVIAKYLDLYNSLVDSLNIELEKLSRHGVWLEIEKSEK